MEDENQDHAEPTAQDSTKLADLFIRLEEMIVDFKSLTCLEHPDLHNVPDDLYQVQLGIMNVVEFHDIIGAARRAPAGGSTQTAMALKLFRDTVRLRLDFEQFAQRFPDHAEAANEAVVVIQRGDLECCCTNTLVMNALTEEAEDEGAAPRAKRKIQKKPRRARQARPTARPATPAQTTPAALGTVAGAEGHAVAVT